LKDISILRNIAADKRDSNASFAEKEIEMKNSKNRLKQVTRTLKAVSGPGDSGEPVITIMLPDED